VTKLIPLSSIRADDVENLLDDAFGADRHQRTAYLLRQGMDVIAHLSFAIIDEDILAGSIQCWPVSVSGAPLILVGPVAVSSKRQNQGIGHQLMNAALCAVSPCDAPMVMIGDPEYYGRFGFEAGGTGGWTLPGPWEPHRLLLRNPLMQVLPGSGKVAPRTPNSCL
jgi:predicted N-acetyltransferase YhbS